MGKATMGIEKGRERSLRLGLIYSFVQRFPEVAGFALSLSCKLDVGSDRAPVWQHRLSLPLAVWVTNVWMSQRGGPAGMCSLFPPDFCLISGEDEDQYEQFMLPLTAAFETVAQMFSTNTFNEQEAKVSWAQPSLLSVLPSDKTSGWLGCDGCFPPVTWGSSDVLCVPPGPGVAHN